MTEYFVNLFRYESWANEEVSACLTKLDDPPEKAISLMSHIINAQDVWLCRITGKSYDVNSVWKTLSKSDIPAALSRSSSALCDYVNNLTEGDIEKTIEYTNIKGEGFKSILKDILTHLIIHSAYHRGQIVMLLKQDVKVLPATDYIKFVRDNDTVTE